MDGDARVRAGRWTRRILTFLPWAVLGGLAIHAVFWLLLPYAANAMQGGDAAGHVFLSRFAREHLFPAPYGWNDRLWLGFPQDTLYPPLVHVLTGLLGGLIGDAAALKLWVGAALLLTFPAAFTLGRALRLSRGGAAGLAASVWALGFLSSHHLGTDLAYGVNLESTFSAGMVVATVGWPLLLWTLALLLREPRPDEAGRAPALLVVALALTLLTHLVAGLLAALALIIRVLTAAHGGAEARRDALRRYGGAGALAVLLSAFWLLPFLLDRGMLSAEAIGLRWTTAETVSLFVPLVLASLAALVRRTPGAVAWALFVWAIVGLTLAIDRFALATHAYRFLPAVWLGGAVALALLLDRVAVGGTILALVAGGAVIALAPGARLAPAGNPALGPLDASLAANVRRTLVAVPQGHQPGYQAVAHAWAVVSDAPVSHGISVESASNNRAIFNVVEELSAELPVWSVYPRHAPALDGDPKRADRWLRKLRHLGFTHILTDLPLEALIGPQEGRGWRYRVTRIGEAGEWTAPGGRRRFRYTLYELPHAGLVLPLDAMPRVVPRGRFEAIAMAAWLQADPEAVLTDAPAPSEVRPADKAVEISVVGVDGDGDHLRFRVGAPQPVPLLVRVAWHPGWEATADGVPIPVHRASPSLILLYAKGRVRLDWRPGPAGPIGAGLGALALLLLLGGWWRERRGAALSA